MANALPGNDYSKVALTRAALPRPQQLAGLGTVLCLYRPQDGGELSGWARAVRVESRAGVDSEGLRESLVFFDRNGDCCWRLCLLPDSDFLAWDRLLASLPGNELMEATSGIAERLWKRLAGRLLGGQWHACIVQLHALPGPPAQPRVLAASLAEVSALGAARARRIAQGEGVEDSIRVDDCCCKQAAFATPGKAAGLHSGGVDEALPVINWNFRK